MGNFVGKVMLSRFVIAFLPRSKCIVKFMGAVTIYSDFGAAKSKISHCFHCFPIYLSCSDGMILVFRMLSFKPAFPLFSFTLSRSSTVPLCFLP